MADPPRAYNRKDDTMPISEYEYEELRDRFDEPENPHAIDYTSLAAEYVDLVFDDCLNNSAFEHLVREHDLDDEHAEEIGYYIEDWDPRPMVSEYRAMHDAVNQAARLLRDLTASTTTDDHLDQLRAILIPGVKRKDITMRRDPADLIAEIKTKRAEARHKMQVFASMPSRLADLYRAVGAATAYDEAIELIYEGYLDLVRARANEAQSVYEGAQNGSVTELMLADIGGRRDALLTVVDLMDGKADL